MAFKIGGSIFVHADVVVKGIPLEGPNANQPFTLLAANALEAKKNGKAITAQGNSIVPVAIAMASAEPSFKVGLDVGQVAIDYAEHCGDGFQRMAHNFVITATRPALAPVTFKIIHAIIENGFDLTTAAGEKLTDELAGKMRALVLHYKGRDYDPYKLPGGVSLT